MAGLPFERPYSDNAVCHPWRICQHESRTAECTQQSHQSSGPDLACAKTLRFPSSNGGAGMPVFLRPPLIRSLRFISVGQLEPNCCQDCNYQDHSDANPNDAPSHDTVQYALHCIGRCIQICIQLLSLLRGTLEAAALTLKGTEDSVAEACSLSELRNAARRAELRSGRHMRGQCRRGCLLARTVFSVAVSSGRSGSEAARIGSRPTLSFVRGGAVAGPIAGPPPRGYL